MRTMRFRGTTQPASGPPQNSDLYTLFCEGLRSRGVANSTVVFTSTPNEEEDDTDVDTRQHQADSREKSPHLNSSTEVQIGSDESPCPSVPLINAVSVPQNVCRKKDSPRLLNKKINPNPCNNLGQIHEVVRELCDDGEPSTGNDQSCRDRRNASPVDFVDHMIAVIRRDNARNIISPKDVKATEHPHECHVQLKKQSEACIQQRTLTVSSQESSDTECEDAARASISFRSNKRLCSVLDKSIKTPQYSQTEVESRKVPIRIAENSQTNLPAQEQTEPNNSKDVRHSDSSEDLLNPRSRKNLSKPRSSASSDAIRLRLSVSVQSNDSEESCNQLSGCEEDSDDGSGERNGAARCRPYHEYSRNLKSCDASSGRVMNNQENARKIISTEMKCFVMTNIQSDPSTISQHRISRPALSSISMVTSKPANQNCRSPSPLSLPKNQDGNPNVHSKSILHKVIAYVEVRSGHDNRSRGVGTQLSALGAQVVQKFCNQVTHLVFNEGSPSILKKAQEKGCHIVSVLWIDACKTANSLVNESEYPALNLHLYDSSNVINKYRKAKSLQPDIDEEKREERINKHLKRIKRKAYREAVEAKKLHQNDADHISPSCLDHPQEIDGVQVPEGIKLKRLSIVLNRVAPNSQSSASSQCVETDKKKQKRKLMPLEQLSSDIPTMEDFDPSDRVKHSCPYLPSTPGKQKYGPPLRRSLRKQESNLDSESQRGINTKNSGSGVSCRPSYESRRSSVFIPRKPKRIRQVRSTSRPRNKNRRVIMPTMVCTFMHRREIDVVAAVLKQLGGWILEANVSSRTTHVVCGDAKRTVNLLRGIARGCWILHQEWVLRSLEAGRWLDEEPYELTTFPAARQCRVVRETLQGCPDIFSSVGALYVAEGTSPPRDAILELLRLCGGHLVNSARQARIIVGEEKRRSSISSIICVKELWVLDSIQENMVKPLRDYYCSKM